MKCIGEKRPISEELKEEIVKSDKEHGKQIAEKLQKGLMAIDLTANSALNTAFAKDVDEKLIFANQILSYGKEDDVLICISTSGNAENVINSSIVAKA